MSPGSGTTASFKLPAPATVGQVDGEAAAPSKPSFIGECPAVEVTAEGVTIPCLLDTGSQVTLFSETFFKKHFNKQAEEKTKIEWLKLKAANGLRIPYVGYAMLDFQIGGIKIPDRGVLIVSDEIMGPEQGLLGMNVIGQVWNTVHLGAHPGLEAFKSAIPQGSRQEWERALACCQRTMTVGPTEERPVTARLTKQQQPVVVPAESEMMLWAHIPEDPGKTHYTALVEGVDTETEWQVAHAVVDVKNHRIPIRVCNPHPYPIEIPQRQPLAKVCRISIDQIHSDHLEFQELPSGELEVAVRAIQEIAEDGTSGGVPQCTNLNQTQQERVDRFLAKWKCVFAQDEEDFGRTSVVQHQIPTGDAPPSRERYRPIPPKLYQELRSMLQDMVDKGIVRESSSPWAAPVVLVKKKSGAWRFCVDYRRLNALTHKDAYPLPRIEESLTTLSKAEWYSTLDLASGYWQVEVDPADREKTAFTTPLGLYEFDRMPFGLCNAPATFQRLMQRCLGSQVNDSLLIYLDDIIVYSDSFDTHLTHLERVFQKLHQHGLKLQPKKCALFKREVSYLGHIVSPQGVAPNPEKIKAVEDWPPPTTVRQVRSFLGLVGYYRRFIHSFSKVAAPLHALTHGVKQPSSKNQTVEWSPDCQRAFESLKQMLVTAPILAYADYKLPFKLYTDASFEGLGAVLCQVQEGKERVIAYASRTLSPDERNDKNYSSFKLELLGLKWAVTEKFKDYLYGNHVDVYTDNNPLVHLNTAGLGAVEQRWVAQLANFDFTLKYRPGKDNSNADALSRRPPEETSSHVMATTEDGVQKEPEGWAERQEEDPTLNAVKAMIQQPNSTQRYKSKLLKAYSKCWHQLQMKGNLLVKLSEEQGSNQQVEQIVVPAGWRRLVWEEYHNAAGHLAGAKTLSLLQRRFYWPGQGDDVHQWSSNCSHCWSQRPQPEVRAPLNSIVTSHPMELVQIDYLSLGRPADAYPYILVATDVFSRYAWAIPTKDQTAVTTAKAFWQHIIHDFGCPQRIHSDRGAQFESAIFSELIHIYGARKSRTTPYHPQGNGSVERLNHTLLTLLSSLEGNEQTHWHRKLPELVHAYNNTVNDSTGLSPFFVMHGRNALLPVDMMMGATTPAKVFSEGGWVQAHHSTLTWAYETVAKHTQRRQAQDQKRHDQRGTAEPLLPGERVLVRNFRWRSQGKLAPRWNREPFVVVSALSPNSPSYRVRPEGQEGPEHTIHRNDLKPCVFAPAQPPPEENHNPATTEVRGYPPMLLIRPQWNPPGTQVNEDPQGVPPERAAPVEQSVVRDDVQEGLEKEQPPDSQPRKSSRVNFGVKPSRYWTE